MNSKSSRLYLRLVSLVLIVVYWWRIRAEICNFLVYINDKISYFISCLSHKYESSALSSDAATQQGGETHFFALQNFLLRCMLAEADMNCTLSWRPCDSSYRIMSPWLLQNWTIAFIYNVMGEDLITSCFFCHSEKTAHSRRRLPRQ